jgi:hypothetical protein
MTLEDLIRDAAARGNMTNLSIAPTPDGKRWRACYAPAKTMGVSFAEDDDPVVAMKEAFRHNKAKRSAIPATRDNADARAGVKHNDMDFG